jgi:hypothetical protein
MTNEEFKHWIHGYLTLSSEEFVSVKQVTIIKSHADLVKIVTGELDEVIIQFIKMLDEKLKQHNNVNISYLKDHANKMSIGIALY